MNKTILGISALIVAISIGTTLVLTSDSRTNQTATAFLADDPKTPILNGQQTICRQQYDVQSNGKMCDYLTWLECITVADEDVDNWNNGNLDDVEILGHEFRESFLYQSLPQQTGLNGRNGPLVAEACLPPIYVSNPWLPVGTLVLPDAPHSQDYSVDKNLDLTFEFESGYPKKLSEKEIEDRGVLTIKDIESYLQANKLSLNNLIAPSSQQIQAVYQQNILKKQ